MTYLLGAPARCLFALALLIAPVAAKAAGPAIVIPDHIEGPKRNITTEDLARLRDIDSLSLSNDGERFAILVRQAAPETNSYRTAWFAGAVAGGALTYLGDGGETRLLVKANGHAVGDIAGSLSRWSPDDRTIAYMVRKDGQVQLWTSRTDGQGQSQATHNAADVRDFAWSEDGASLYFQVGSTRAELAAQAEAKARSGYRLQDFDVVYRALGRKPPALPLETKLTVWRIGADGSDERPATTAERAAFEAALARQFDAKKGGVESDIYKISAALGPPVRRGDGAAAWLERADPSQDGPLPVARLRAVLKEGDKPIVCEAPACAGQFIMKVWWSKNGRDVVFLSLDGRTETSFSLYAWRPTTGALRTLTSGPDHVLRECALAGRAVVCLRETPLEPRYVAAFDVATGAMTKVANVNPEMANFKLGRVERIEWDSDPRADEFRYSPRSNGFILYPPGYDPKRSYPVFVAPYTAGGFLRGDVGDEHPLLVYSANGFIVLNSSRPQQSRQFSSNDFVANIRRLYDPKEGYPHLSIFVDSTFRGMDLAMTRANIDPARVGIGGVSHGAFVPLLMMQQRDRFAALSVASGSWSQIEYYFLKLPEPYGDRPLTNFPEDADFWAPLDLSQHLDTIEAPILFQMADAEVATTGILIRRMVDARLPVEAFSFPDELHIKWQPAHRLAIYNRNLDWFRFWLQDVEDPDPGKVDQYARWRKLRELQCKNPRALRNLCDVQSRFEPPAR